LDLLLQHGQKLSGFRLCVRVGGTHRKHYQGRSQRNGLWRFFIIRSTPSRHQSPMSSLSGRSSLAGLIDSVSIRISSPKKEPSLVTLPSSLTTRLWPCEPLLSFGSAGALAATIKTRFSTALAMSWARYGASFESCRRPDSWLM